MQRRARIKAVANLSASRRTTAKASSETQNKTIENDSESHKSQVNEVEQEVNAQIALSVSLSSSVSPSSTDVIQKIDENVSADDLHVKEKKLESTLVKLEDTKPNVASNIEKQVIAQDESATFKTPQQMHRSESEPSGSATSHSTANKFRRFKMAPRLNTSRNVAKAPEIEESVKKNDESQIETVQANGFQDAPPDFTPPPRPETPREVFDAPTFITNHNIQHPTAPPSPFPYLSHGRIRTESLCSIKSNRDVTVANLQPRKNIRTEDQKIIDIKRESRERLSNKDLDKSQLRMFDMIYFNPQNNPMKPRSDHKIEKPKKIELIQETAPVAQVKKEPTAMPVPQLKIDANGDMVLDETSLVVENEQQKQNRILLASANVVYDDDLSGNYGYYKRQQRTKEWQHDETVKFYRCLNTVGTDFSLMLNLFPNRSRRDLKLKFKKEEKNNPQLIDKALLKHNTFDLDELQRELDEEEEVRRKEVEAKCNTEVKELVKRKILKKQEARLKAEQQAKTKIQKILSDGDLAMSIVDHNLQMEVKENLALAGQKKRQYKKRVKVPVDPPTLAALKPSQTMHIMEGLVDVAAVDTSIKPKRSRQPRKKAVASYNEEDPDPSNPSTSQEPPMKKQRRSRKKAVIIEFQAVDVPINHNLSQQQFKLEPEVSTKTFAPIRRDFKTEIVTELVHIEWKMESSSSTMTVSQIENLPIINSEILPPSETTSTISAACFYDESRHRIEMTEAKTVSGIAQALDADVVMTETELILQPQDVTMMEAEIVTSSTEDQNRIEYQTPALAPAVDFAEDVSIDEQAFELIQATSVSSVVQQFQDETFKAPEIPSEVNLIQTDFLQPADENVQSQVPEAAPSSQLNSMSAPDAALLPSPEKKSEKKPKTKSRKKKFRPTLVTRLKLDANGEMVLDDSSVTVPGPEPAAVEIKEENLAQEESKMSEEQKMPEEALTVNQELHLEEVLHPDQDMLQPEDVFQPEDEILPTEDDVLPPYLSSSFIDSALFDQEDFLQSVDIPVDENLNETIAIAKFESVPMMTPSTSSNVIPPLEEFDGEAFLNSLDLEKLVLVEAQRDGEDVYEIHEIDPITQEICDAPMDLPARVVDLIISVMTQQEDDDGE